MATGRKQVGCSYSLPREIMLRWCVVVDIVGLEPEETGPQARIHHGGGSGLSGFTDARTFSYSPSLQRRWPDRAPSLVGDRRVHPVVLGSKRRPGKYVHRRGVWGPVGATGSWLASTCDGVLDEASL